MDLQKASNTQELLQQTVCIRLCESVCASLFTHVDIQAQRRHGGSFTQRQHHQQQACQQLHHVEQVVVGKQVRCQCPWVSRMGEELIIVLSLLYVKYEEHTNHKLLAFSFYLFDFSRFNFLLWQANWQVRNFVWEAPLYQFSCTWWKICAVWWEVAITQIWDQLVNKKHLKRQKLIQIHIILFKKEMHSTPCQALRIHTMRHSSLHINCASLNTLKKFVWVYVFVLTISK